MPRPRTARSASTTSASSRFAFTRRGTPDTDLGGNAVRSRAPPRASAPEAPQPVLPSGGRTVIGSPRVVPSRTRRPLPIRSLGRPGVPCGVVVRVLYTLWIQRPESMIYSDMGIYVDLARRMVAGIPLIRPDVTHPLGYASLLAFLIGRPSRSLALAINVQLVVSCLVPLAVGLLGATAYGRRTAIPGGRVREPVFPVHRVRRAVSVRGSLHLLDVDHVRELVCRATRPPPRGRASASRWWAGTLRCPSPPPSSRWRCRPRSCTSSSTASLSWSAARRTARAFHGSRGSPRLKPWVLRGALVAVAAAPLLGVLARVCTRANDGRVLRHRQQDGRRLPDGPLRAHRGSRMGVPRATISSASAALARCCATTTPTRGCHFRSRTTRPTRPRRGAGSASTRGRPSCCRSITSTTRSSARRCGRRSTAGCGRTQIWLNTYSSCCCSCRPCSRAPAS